MARSRATPSSTAGCHGSSRPLRATGASRAPPAYDLANIATHEFGHTYGLDHPANARWETMYAFGFTGETLKRSLGAGDTDGIRSRY